MSPTLAAQLLAPCYSLWEGRGWFDLSDLNVRGLIEHDASFLREDVNSPFALTNPDANQSTPSRRLIQLYFPADAPDYTPENFSRIIAHARRTSRGLNGQFRLTTLQFMFGSGNCGLALDVVGPRVDVLRAWFGADGFERFPEGFEPGNRAGCGVVSLERASKRLCRVTDFLHGSPSATDDLHRTARAVGCGARCRLARRTEDARLEQQRGGLVCRTGSREGGGNEA